MIELQTRQKATNSAEGEDPSRGKKASAAPKAAKAKAAKAKTDKAGHVLTAGKIKPLKPKDKGAKSKSAKSKIAKPVGVVNTAMLSGGETFDLSESRWYLNRELTWLAFNQRVLHEAEDIRTPLLERLKFIAIVSANLDEFFMKRIGGLKQQIGAGMRELTLDGRTPRQQVTESYIVVRALEARKQSSFSRSPCCWKKRTS